MKASKRKQNKFECYYKTMLKDYSVTDRGIKEELITLNRDIYHRNYSKWFFLKNLKQDAIRDWRPCEYFHQLNTALAASHSVLNYSIFLALMNKKLTSRKLLILDEAHMLEAEIVRFRGISISRGKWRKYIPDLIIDNHGYDVGRWLGFLYHLETEMARFIVKLLEHYFKGDGK